MPMIEPVLLTGATGFVGRAVLAELVACQVPVHAVSRGIAPPMAGVVWHQADLLSPEGRAQIAGLAPRMIHCAWHIEHGAFWTSPANDAWHHASLDLVRRWRSHGGTRMIALGTCAEYDADDAGPWDEHRPIRPTTAYGKAKAALWRDLSDLCGEDLIWARLFHLFGPGEDARRFVPQICQRLAAGQPADVLAPHLIRDYAPTSHVAKCLCALLQTRCMGAIDIASGRPVTLGEMAGWIASAFEAFHLLRLSATLEQSPTAAMAPLLHRLQAHMPFAPLDINRQVTDYAKTFRTVPQIGQR